MRRWALGAVAAAIAVGGATGCALTSSETRLDLPAGARTIEDRILYAPTTWSGSVRITRPVVVTRSATLTLLPGTRVFFDVPSPATDAERQPWIRVIGGLVAVGTDEQPIVFASVEPRRNELDDMVKVEAAKRAIFRYCIFERGPWGIHAHESPVEVASSIFRAGYGGIRFQGGRVVMWGNRFQSNTTGVRCLKASPVFEENSFLGNLTGIFFREGVQGAVLKRNNFDDAEYDVKLGEGQADDVDAAQNWWGPPGKGPLGDRIYDAADAPGLGRVTTDPPLTAAFGVTEKKR